MFSSKLHKPRNTLALRLTLWYAGIFTLSSLIVFLLFYMLVATAMRDRTDEELTGHARRFAYLMASEGVEEVRKAAIIEAQAAGVRKVFFRLLYADGVAFSSTNMAYWQDIGIHARAIKELIEGKDPVFETDYLYQRKDEIRVLYTMLSPEIILQIGESREDSMRLLDAFRRIFLFTMIFLTMLAAAIGWFMARRAVSGVAAVTRTARHISEGSLNERVPVHEKGDEIDLLAVTFNEMLNRIESLIKEMKEMSDNIAHDLKSPITRIRGAAEITLSTGAPREEFESMAASTIEECDRLLEMINTMLMISRTESGIDRPPAEIVDLGRLVLEACELFEPAASDKEVSLQWTIEDNVVMQGDTKMLRRLVANLIDNAIKYTPGGGSVHVGLSRSGENIRLSVKDTGIGIGEKDIPHIFERFYRGDRSRSESGLGLGLSLAQAIARAHGGDIAVMSTPKVGTTFTFTFVDRKG
ncbi:MAG: sensor histidine kinase [Syntrophorhabdaceae bacterium]